MNKLLQHDHEFSRVLLEVMPINLWNTQIFIRRCNVLEDIDSATFEYIAMLRFCYTSNNFRGICKGYDENVMRVTHL